MDYADSDLIAVDATNIATPLYTSNAVAADAYTAPAKFTLPTVANGMAYLATTTGAFIGDGLRTAYLSSNAAYFGAPTQLTAAAVTFADVRLAWASHATLAGEFRIDRSANGTA